MSVLTSQQRKTLENIVVKARTVSETGAMNALHSLAVDNSLFFPHMSSEQKELRNRLRSKARLLGDILPLSGQQQITHLSYELAYEYWHKMLFAKFLEANGLLIHSDGVAVTMAECEELATEERYLDKWDAASAYASKMLPAIFRVNDPLMHVEFATEDRIKLESLLDEIENDIFTADDALGWVYQFWQSEAKAKINASGDKINGEKLPAVTQLFTEPYMVNFLIDNTVGAWWVSRNPGVTPPIKFEYLRTLEDGKPAAGSFEGWPDKTAEVTSLDPCMGSGHFVVSLFTVFANLRIYEEGLTKEEATDRVITENLNGLEIDPRCTQIAAFNLALTAWKFCGHYKELPEMNLACSGIAPKGKKEDWVKLVGNVSDPGMKTRMENGMSELYDHFQLAPELGSLLDPSTIKSDAFTASFEELQPILMKAFASEDDKEQIERGVIAAGITRAGQILSEKYTLHITNVPYLTRGKQAKIMVEYFDKNFPIAKGDLATVFLNKMNKSNISGGYSCIVMPQNCLFLKTYKNFRTNLLQNESWSIIARLGTKGFQTPMWDFNVMLICLGHNKPVENHSFYGIDVAGAKNGLLKAEALKNTSLKKVKQNEQLKNPGALISFEEVSNSNKLEKFSTSIKGTDTGDDPKFVKNFWEIQDSSFPFWMKYQTTPDGSHIFNGKNRVLLWEDEKGSFINDSNGTVRKRDTLSKKAIAIRLTGKLEASLFSNSLFDTNVAAIIPINENDLCPIFTYCDSDDFHMEVRKLDQALKATSAIITKVPFDIEHWQKVANEKYPNGLPKPYSDDSTQWLFHGHPIKADNPLQVAVARFLGYKWPAESDAEMELTDEARELIEEIKQFDSLSDEDGIVCIPSVNGELAAADRLRNYLQTIFGDQWNNQTITSLLEKEGANKTNLDDWLREEFFIQHCKLFNNRPFIWHIWDGRKDGFSVLVNYHKLTKENLQKLIYTYLGDWIRQCEAKKKDGESGAEGLLSAAMKLKEKLESILIGESPLDIFVRWKPIEEQPIGWDPDLNDGVRLNIRPFIQAEVLKKKPNIKWGIDRGKNPAGSPWGEIRDNDKHLILAEKQAARTKTKKG